MKKLAAGAEQKLGLLPPSGLEPLLIKQVRAIDWELVFGRVLLTPCIILTD